MDQALALFISIALVLILMRKIDIGLSLLFGSIFLAILTLGSGGPLIVFRSYLDVSTLKVVAIVILAFTLGHLMENLGMLEKIAEELAKSFGALSFLIIPLLIGLLPMPGGALVSAVMLAPILRRYKIEPEKVTFLNYWYRHVWVTVWPLYPSVIIASAVLEIDYLTFASATYPIAFFAFISGLFLTRGLEKKLSISKSTMKNLVSNFYPIILLVLLTVLLKLELLYSLLICLVILILQRRDVNLLKVIRKTIDPKIIVLVFAVMGYKAVIEQSGAAKTLLSEISSGLPVPVAAFLLMLIVGFATGMEMSYSSISLPLLLSFTGSGEVILKNIMLAISGGFVGVMLSPLHLCYVLTAEYFKADMWKSYRILIPAALSLTLLTSLVYLFI